VLDKPDEKLKYAAVPSPMQTNKEGKKHGAGNDNEKTSELHSDS